MAATVIMGALAAFGAMSAVWAALGWLLPAGQGCALVCWGTPDEGILSRWRWLRGMGLLRCPLIAVAGEKCPGTEVCAAQALVPRLEMERNAFHGTGNGDHSGHRQCHRISEL